MKQRLKIKDLFFVALYGVRARRGRAALTSIGIGIGIAAIVAVTGISASGRADLLATLESLGTNLIKASPQAGFFGTQEKLPDGVVGMVERIGPVEAVTYTTQTDLIVRRSDFISEFEGGGISTIVTSPELLQVVEKERPFFDQSGGGVTFSGGEPLLYPEFLIELLEACGRQGVHRAVDTSGFVKKEVLLKVAQHTDLFLYDLKMVDAEKHKRYTGVDNRLILDNLVALAEYGSEVQIRIPLIGGVNDDDDSVAAMATYVAALPGEKRAVSLLPFHDVARGKDEKLGQERDLAALHEPGADALQRVIEIFAGYGLTATIGG